VRIHAHHDFVTIETYPCGHYRDGAHECAPYKPGLLPASRCHDEYGQSFGCSTNPCLTGLIQQYRTHAANALSSRMWRSQNGRCNNPPILSVPFAKAAALPIFGQRIPREP
jgi:hypothetical protein